MRSYVFSLCPDSHFAHEQFRNCTAQSKNSYFARQSENSHFAQDISRIVPILTCADYIYACRMLSRLTPTLKYMSLCLLFWPRIHRLFR